MLIALSLELSEGKKWQRGMIDGVGPLASSGFEVVVAVSSGQSVIGFRALVRVSEAFFKKFESRSGSALAVKAYNAKRRFQALG